MFFFLVLKNFPSQQNRTIIHTYLTNLIIIITNFLLLQSCTKPFGSGYCHDDQTGDMLRCSTVCIHFLARPLHLPCVTLPALLYSIDGVCVLWILHFFSLSSFPLSPFLCLRGRKNYPKSFEWNTNHEFRFLFLALLLGKTV